MVNLILVQNPLLLRTWVEFKTDCVLIASLDKTFNEYPDPADKVEKLYSKSALLYSLSQPELTKK
jgi:hypothetical protein